MRSGYTSPNCNAVLPLPSAKEVAVLRKQKTDRRLKSPTLGADLNASNPVLGRFETKPEGAEVRVVWAMKGRPERTALFSALCNDEGLRSDRLELGWLIANGWRVEGLRLLRSIPGPNEAMQEAGPYFREEARWRAWALAAPRKQGRASKSARKKPAR